MEEGSQVASSFTTGVLEAVKKNPVVCTVVGIGLTAGLAFLGWYAYKNGIFADENKEAFNLEKKTKKATKK